MRSGELDNKKAARMLQPVAALSLLSTASCSCLAPFPFPCPPRRRGRLTLRSSHRDPILALSLEEGWPTRYDLRPRSISGRYDPKRICLFCFQLFSSETEEGGGAKKASSSRTQTPRTPRSPRSPRKRPATSGYSAPRNGNGREFPSPPGTAPGNEKFASTAAF